MAVSRSRIYETLMMIISKLKIDLMDQASAMYKAVAEIEQEKRLDAAYQQIEEFILGRIKTRCNERYRDDLYNL